VKDAIRRNVVGEVDIIPANVNLAGAEVEMITSMDGKNSSTALRDALNSIEKDYDFILIDCPPSLNILTVNAMTAAKTVLVPIQCEYYALEGLSQLIGTINLVRERLNPKLKIEGVVFTMFDARTNLSMEVVQSVKTNISEHIYQTIIPRSVRLAEAPSYGEPITVYDPKSTGAAAYRSLAKEVADRDDL
jgi:chromosome partitioning protein